MLAQFEKRRARNIMMENFNLKLLLTSLRQVCQWILIHLPPNHRRLKPGRAQAVRHYSLVQTSKLGVGAQVMNNSFSAFSVTSPLLLRVPPILQWGIIDLVALPYCEVANTVSVMTVFFILSYLILSLWILVDTFIIYVVTTLLPYVCSQVTRRSTLLRDN